MIGINIQNDCINILSGSHETMSECQGFWITHLLAFKLKRLYNSQSMP